jgi:hypothetical protein
MAFSALEKLLPSLELNVAEISRVGQVRQRTDYSKYTSQLDPIFLVWLSRQKPCPVAFFENFLIE